MLTSSLVQKDVVIPHVHVKVHVMCYWKARSTVKSVERRW